jgi:hypothetical protein
VGGEWAVVAQGSGVLSAVETRCGMREERNAYKILVGKPERKRPFGRLSCRGIML